MPWQTIALAVHAVYAIWAVIDLFRNPRFAGLFRLMLLLSIIFVPLIGPTIYVLLRDAEPKDPLMK